MPVAVMAAALTLTIILAAALYRQSRRIQALQAQLQAAAVDLQRLQQACSRLAPPSVVQQLIVDGASPDAAGMAERKIATALFVDLVGFTEMSERLEAATMMRILNGYYERMTEAIDEHRGRLGPTPATASSPISARFSRTRGNATMRSGPPSRCAKR